MSVEIWGVGGIGEVMPGTDIAALIADATTARPLADGDVVVVTHKIVSKAEGQLVNLRTVTPTALAVQIAEQFGKDARQVEVVLRESVRIVRMERGIIISETRHGLICANAAVDASNVAGETVCLLPRDPDASAARIRAALRERTGVDVAVIISDSFGRPWRNGIVNFAIGVAGMQPLTDYRGQTDPFGNDLRVTVIAVADELACASELAMGKVENVPVAVIRGYAYDRADGTAHDLIMDPAKNLFH
ncbi:MAG: coenzyme F420-0:L-glutamate ligase [Thermomicrobia bacterium]|nr:coenzyme F420-0:L-glutamate ligase [Thermomicrobia bacterium]